MDAARLPKAFTKLDTIECCGQSITTYYRNTTSKRVTTKNLGKCNQYKQLLWKTQTPRFYGTPPFNWRVPQKMVPIEGTVCQVGRIKEKTSMKQEKYIDLRKGIKNFPTPSLHSCEGKIFSFSRTLTHGKDTNYKAGRVRALARRCFNAITRYTNQSIWLQEYIKLYLYKVGKKKKNKTTYISSTPKVGNNLVNCNLLFKESLTYIFLAVSDFQRPWSMSNLSEEPDFARLSAIKVGPPDLRL